MDDYLPQDEYFEWEEVLGYNPAVGMETDLKTVPHVSISKCRTSFSKTLEEAVDRSLEGFKWNESSHDSCEELSSFSGSGSECTSPSNGDSSDTSEDDSQINLPTHEDSESAVRKDCTFQASDESPSTSYIPTNSTKDDICLLEQPWRNVDYLSHDWNQPEVWATWKYLVSTRNEHEKISRLENATWRSWTKIQYSLRTISPQTFNWLKDCDDTWLYGPFHCSPQSSSGNRESKQAFQSGNRTVRPVLKKHHMSEILIRGSVPTTNAVTRTIQGENSQKLAPKKTSATPNPSPIRKRFSSNRLSVVTSTPARQCESQFPWKGVKFLEEVEQYTSMDLLCINWDDTEETICSLSNNSDDRRTVYKLPSTTLKCASDFHLETGIPSRINPENPRRSSNLSEWMWLSDEDDLDERESISPKTANSFSTTAGKPPPDSGTTSLPTTNPESSTRRFLSNRYQGLHLDDDQTETEYLLTCDQDSMESMTPDPSDYLSSESDDPEDDYFLDYDGRDGSDYSKERSTRHDVPILEQEKDLSYEQMMEEFNLILE